MAEFYVVADPPTIVFFWFKYARQDFSFLRGARGGSFGGKE